MTGSPSTQDINGLLSGYVWTFDNLTYSFPTSSSNYGSSFYGDGEPYSGFHAFSPAQQDVVRYALKLVSQYTLLTFTEITETDSSHGDCALQTSRSRATSYGNFPPPYPNFGDVWLGNIAFDPATKGSYAFSYHPA